MALQLHCPDLFGGAWAFNPDPIDFTRYQLIDIYKEANILEYVGTEWQVAQRPFRRSREGLPGLSVRNSAKLELMIGERGRGFYQLAIWQSTYGPTDKDGYPRPLFDHLTGVIDREVAEYYRKNGYDLTHYARANWSRLGPKLAGRLNFIAGEGDEFFLNLGVYKFRGDGARHRRRRLSDPVRIWPAQGGAHLAPHRPTGVTREMAANLKNTAPPGARTDDWNYSKARVR